MIKFFGTVFYIGYFPFFPGTFASMISLIFGVLFFKVFGFVSFLLFTVILFLGGWWCCEKIITRHNNKDPSEIVIDELVGQWISIIPIFYFLDFQKITFSSLPYLELIFAFIIFRLFDIVKIGPILWADNLKSGLGVMLDDCLAGCVTFSLITFYLIII